MFLWVVIAKNLLSVVFEDNLYYRTYFDKFQHF